jgi:hypothetical protein
MLACMFYISFSISFSYAHSHIHVLTSLLSVSHETFMVPDFQFMSPFSVYHGLCFTALFLTAH